MAWRCDGCGGEHTEQPSEELQRTICRHYTRICSYCVRGGVTTALLLKRPCVTCVAREHVNGGSK
jgi:hypothetical protein